MDLYLADGADIKTESIDGFIVIATAINPWQARRIVENLNLLETIQRDMAAEDAYQERLAIKYMQVDDSFNIGE